MSSAENLATLAAIELELNKRLPENRIEPTIDRILALTDALGLPQLSYPTIHLAGTNGKTTTSRMIDQLLSNLGYRVGRYTSPHLQSFTERISIKGEPITAEKMIETYRDIELYLDLIDSRQPYPLSYFEVLTALAFVAFAEYPIDIGVIEAGMGGQWDATNVLASQVSVMTPIGFDHMEYLGNTLTEIALTKSGIFKPESNVVLSAQTPEVAKVLLAQAAKVSAIVFREGVEFAVKKRSLAVGGQLISLKGLFSEIEDIFLPLYGVHQANNAALALASVEAFTQVKIDEELVRKAFSEVKSPGRCEIIYKDPLVIIDAAHNPHGISALAKTINSEFDFENVIAVIGVFADKDVEGILKELSNMADQIVLTQTLSPRALPAEKLANLAANYFKAEQIEVVADFNQALKFAMERATLANQVSDGVTAVVITGSVTTVGNARSILKELGAKA
jgi:dihydrofolate synthase/folylpolyglutamate synthase